MRNIAIVNVSTVVSDAEAAAASAAIEIQINRDFAPIWGTDQVKLTPFTKTATIPPGWWELVIADNSDQAGALGYHETTVNGDPIGYVFAKDTKSDGLNWTVTFSHEALEMVADPYINSVSEVDNIDSTISFYGTEACDAVEDDSLGYKIGSVLVSDFVTPEWFIPTLSGKQLDFQKKVSKPLQLLPNGYISLLQTSTGSWTQITARTMDTKAAKRAVPQPYHRRFRRRMHRKLWQRSLH